MKKVRITVMRISCYTDLSARYENSLDNACDMQIGQVFVSEDCRKPEEMCESAWMTMAPFVMTLACGGTDLYDGWMKNRHSAMISCNDGFRPVSFYLEAMEDEKEK
jgi:uncharacterized repeat protein (TIGR04076 family)